MYQAKAELLAGDLKGSASNKVIALLSNLKEYWLFLWVENRNVVTMFFKQPDNAKLFLSQFLSASTESVERNPNGIEIPFTNERIPLKKLCECIFPPREDNLGFALEDLERYELLDEVEPEVIAEKKKFLTDALLDRISSFGGIPERF